MSSTEEALAELDNTPGGILKYKATFIMENASEQLGKNLLWGKNILRNLVDPEKVQNVFDDNAKFNAELSKIFPHTYAKLTQMRQNLKIHYNELIEVVNDLKYLAQSTDKNLQRSYRKI
jgi:phytoene dehydrogenase-like protein